MKILKTFLISKTRIRCRLGDSIIPASSSLQTSLPSLQLPLRLVHKFIPIVALWVNTVKLWRKRFSELVKPWPENYMPNIQKYSKSEYLRPLVFEWPALSRDHSKTGQESSHGLNTKHSPTRDTVWISDLSGIPLSIVHQFNFHV